MMLCTNCNASPVVDGYNPPDGKRLCRDCLADYAGVCDSGGHEVEADDDGGEEDE